MLTLRTGMSQHLVRVGSPMAMNREPGDRQARRKSGAAPATVSSMRYHEATGAIREGGNA